jgi:hypothetical protein
VGGQSGLVKQKVALKDKKVRTQINGKFNDISSADENGKKNHCRACN